MDIEQKGFYQNSEIYFNLLLSGDKEYFFEYLSFIKYYIPSGEYLLDAGCGTGQSTAMLSEQGYKVLGLDGAERFIEHAKIAFSNNNFLHDDLENLSIPDNTFDAIASYNTIEHVRDVKKVIIELVRAVKPGGLILIHSPNLLSIKHLSDAVMKRSGMTFEGKKNFFQIILMFLRNVFWLTRRRLFNYSKFIYRVPDYNFSFPDNDASVFLNPLDVKLCLKEAGCQIISYQKTDHLSTGSFIKKIGSYFFSDHMSIIRIVAKKYDQ